MSASKWHRLWQLAMLHGVEAEAWEGVKVLQGQFFMQLTDRLWAQWEQSAMTARHSRRQPPRPANGRLEKKLRRMEERDDVAQPVCSVLRAATVLAQCLLTADRWVRQLLMLGLVIQREGDRVDSDTLEEWTAQLNMGSMLQLECILLAELLDVSEEKMPVAITASEKQRQDMVEEVVETIATTRHQWQLSQGNRIFVHASSSKDMLWQARHSARFLKYYPAESISMVFNSFLQSLTNIEE